MRTAFIFPGQGSLDGDPLGVWRGHERATAVVDRVCAATGIDLWDLPADAGARTAIAQPAIFAASLAAAAELEAGGFVPDAVAGHSLGELTAAVAAGAVDLDAAAELVAVRGAAFAVACERDPGTMAALVRLDLATVEAVVAAIDGVTVANVNAPGQVVVSGTPAAVERAREIARERGGRGLPLDVEGAFHSPAMTSAVTPFDAALRRTGLRDPELPLVTGTGGRILTDADGIRRALLDGVLSPVQWVAVQERLVAMGVERLVEVGPGGVLTGLARRTVPDVVELWTVAAPDDLHVLGSAPDAAPEPAATGASR